jgi:hypothetical protein
MSEMYVVRYPDEGVKIMPRGVLTAAIEEMQEAPRFGPYLAKLPTLDEKIDFLQKFVPGLTIKRRG